MAAILNCAMLDSDTAILDSDTLLFLSDSLKNTLPPLWLWLKLIHLINLMMATILNSLEFCHLGFSHLHKTLTQTSSIWLKLIHSDSTWWWQPSWILPSWIQPFCTKRTSLIHSDSTWWWQPSWILPCWIQTLPSWIQTPCYLLSDSLKNTLTPLWLCLKLIPSDKLNDGNQLEFILNSAILDSAILHKTLTQTSSIWLKLIHSHSTWWWQPSWILPCWISLPSWIQKPSLIFSQTQLEKHGFTSLWLLNL